jgi:hypothetical protein
MSARPHGTFRLPLSGFSRDLIFEDFSEISPENSSHNPLKPELNPSAQRCLTRFLLGILLL